MKIPFFNYPALFIEHETVFVSIFKDVGRRGAFIMQSDLVDFEKRLAEYTGANYALGVGNATDGLEMLLTASNIGPGDEVIFCGHTMVATAGAIHMVGATPVACDAGPDHLMDPASARAKVTDKTRAIMPTQLNGRVCDMDALQEIADEHSLLIIEDSAQGLGAKYKGRFAGTFGVGGCISFYPAKNLGALGDGGAVLINDPEIYKNILSQRDHGRDPQSGDTVSWGRNSRLDNLQAAILNYLFDSYGEIVARRREIASIYQAELHGINALVLPPPPTENSNHFDVFQNYEIEADRRDELKAHLAEQGVGTLVQWGGHAVHEFPALQIPAKLPYTERMMRQSLMVPLNLSITDEEVRFVCSSIQEFYAND